MHGTRLGLYGLLEQMQKKTFSNSTAATMGTAVCWGGVTGFVGSIVASPFFLIKTQIQAQSHGTTAVGYQHNYTGTLNAFRTIYARYGWFGFWHGFEGFAIRITICTGLQMMAYDVFKQILQQQPMLAGHPSEMAFLASISSGLICSVGTTPIDVIATRLYNQGIFFNRKKLFGHVPFPPYVFFLRSKYFERTKFSSIPFAHPRICYLLLEVDHNGRGKYYRNVFDCCRKIVRIEGIGGLFKGFVPICLKYGPHTIVTLTTWEWLKHRRNHPSD